MHSQAKGADLLPRGANAAVLQEARARLIDGAGDEHGVQVANVTAGQSQGFDLGELPVRRLGRDQGPQRPEGRVHAAQRRSQSYHFLHNPLSIVTSFVKRSYRFTL